MSLDPIETFWDTRLVSITRLLHTPNTEFILNKNGVSVYAQLILDKKTRDIHIRLARGTSTTIAIGARYLFR